MESVVFMPGFPGMMQLISYKTYKSFQKYMKKLFNTNQPTSLTDVALLITRITIAILMLTHGLPKLALFNHTPVPFVDFLGLGPTVSLTLTIFAEVICSLFILLGLGTRIAAIPLIITMVVAVLYVHGADPIAKQEPGIHYMLTYVLLLIMGSGKYSVDHLLTTRSRKTSIEQFSYEH
jgi:putative oxidoreductase